MIAGFELAQLFTTIFMTGLIWFVQLVHYPLFSLVQEDASYYREHQRRTTWVVLPPMLTELISAIALFLLRGSFLDQCGLALLAVIWLSTMCLQVPCHVRLVNEFSQLDTKRLTVRNWVRTVAWTLRSTLLLYLVHQC